MRRNASSGFLKRFRRSAFMALEMLQTRQTLYGVPMRMQLAVPIVLAGLAMPMLLHRSGARQGSPEQPADEAPELVSWQIHVDEAEVVASAETPVTAMGPYFESVRLERGQGTSRVSCGEFPAPVMKDSGVGRYWIYSLPRPRSGSCGGSASDYVAIGTRAAVETRSARR